MRQRLGFEARSESIPSSDLFYLLREFGPKEQKSRYYSSIFIRLNHNEKPKLISFLTAGINFFINQYRLQIKFPISVVFKNFKFPYQFSPSFVKGMMVWFKSFSCWSTSPFIVMFNKNSVALFSFCWPT